MRGVFLLLGTNLGGREVNLRTALASIEKKVGEIEKTSSIYETSAWGIEAQPDFLNQAIQVNTALDPDALLRAILEIEKEMGRERVVKWGTRLIDIDILFYHDEVINTPGLAIPHPEFKKRKFALAPMTEIASDETFPASNETIAILNDTCKDNLPVWIYRPESRIATRG